MAVAQNQNHYFQFGGKKNHNFNAPGSKFLIKLKKNIFYIPRNKNYRHLIAIIY